MAVKKNGKVITGECPEWIFSLQNARKLNKKPLSDAEQRFMLKNDQACLTPLKYFFVRQHLKEVFRAALRRNMDSASAICRKTTGSVSGLVRIVIKENMI